MLPGESWPRVLHRSWATRAINVVLCFLSATFVFVYFRRYVYFFPITVESIWQIFLAEINRIRNKRRVDKLREDAEDSRSAEDEEKGALRQQSAIRCLASVVGYREEAGLFRRCLESYKDAPGLEILLVGIDGNEPTDMEMVQIVKNVSIMLAINRQETDKVSGFWGENNRNNRTRTTRDFGCSPRTRIRIQEVGRPERHEA